jgi:two-component system, NarL family, response regulator LiaR
VILFWDYNNPHKRILLLSVKCVIPILNKKVFAPQDEEKKPPTDYHITPKETEILNFLAKGKSYQEISDMMFISIKTLKWHIFNIYKKLHADNRTEALNNYFGRHL